jgi:GxxExxY protein
MMVASEKKDERTYAIIGAAMEVHRQLGCGFLEAVYQQAFELELTARQIPFRREVELPITDRGQQLASGYRVDFLCYESILVELKALSNLSGVEEAQVLNYLKASGRGIGLLLNFGKPSLEHSRFVFSKSVKSA